MFRGKKIKVTTLNARPAYISVMETGVTERHISLSNFIARVEKQRARIR